MPFTPSHVAAILPFARTPLLPAGLTIGSMVPDLPYFVPIGLSRGFTHSLGGAVVVDLPMGIACYLIWVFLLRAPLLDFAPRWLHDRFRVRRTARPVWASALLLLAALVVGIATHLAWDSFTHSDGWVVLHVAALRANLGPLALARWLQYASSAFGILVLAIWATGWVRTSVAEPLAYLRTGRTGRLAAWIAIASTLVVIGAIVWLLGQFHVVEAFNRGLLHYTATYSIAAAGLLALVACLAWYLFPRRGHDQTERSTATTLPSTWA
jgi:hypothetical protein